MGRFHPSSALGIWGGFIPQVPWALPRALWGGFIPQVPWDWREVSSIKCPIRALWEGNLSIVPWGLEEVTSLKYPGIGGGFIPLVPSKPPYLSQHPKCPNPNHPTFTKTQSALTQSALTQTALHCPNPKCPNPNHPTFLNTQSASPHPMPLNHPNLNHPYHPLHHHPTSTLTYPAYLHNKQIAQTTQVLYKHLTNHTPKHAQMQYK